jgi:hypothetical protein
MKKISLSQAIIILSLSLVITLSGCSEKWDIEEKGVPRFVKVNYIELDNIDRISRFRSSEGHDYSDSHENCRRMKHYYHPYENINWGTVKIFSPVAGTITVIFYDGIGASVHIESSEYPAYKFIIFHMNLDIKYSQGDYVEAGEQLGTHIGSKTMSDIAVRVKEGTFTKRLVSYFDVMTDDLFVEYQYRGISNRQVMIIPETARDSDPCTCSGQSFTSRGSIESWINLSHIQPASMLWCINELQAIPQSLCLLGLKGFIQGSCTV